VAKWGNSLGLRLPKSVAIEAHIDDGDMVDVVVENGVIVIRPAGRRYSLDELVEGISARNRHRETDWGKPVGREVW
jgi:antitoxin MazE